MGSRDGILRTIPHKCVRIEVSSKDKKSSAPRQSRCRNLPLTISPRTNLIDCGAFGCVIFS